MIHRRCWCPRLRTRGSAGLGGRPSAHRHLRMVHRCPSGGSPRGLRHTWHRMSGLWIGRRRSRGTRGRLRADIPERRFKTLHRRPHLRWTVRQTRRLGTARSGRDDFFDCRLYPKALGQLWASSLWRSSLMRLVLSPRNARYDERGNGHRQPHAVSPHRSLPLPMPGVSLSAPAAAGASSPSPARNPWSCSAARHASFRLSRYSVDISKNVRCATSTCG